MLSLLRMAEWLWAVEDRIKYRDARQTGKYACRNSRFLWENLRMTLQLKKAPNEDQRIKNGRMQVRLSEVEIIAVSSVESFRRLAKELPGNDDAVLEIGCSTGTSTRILAETGARVVAVDNSAEMSARSQHEMKGRENVSVVMTDGRNVSELAALLPDPTMLFVDIGGNAHLDNVALLLRLCLRAFCPRVLVVRSFELATLASLIGSVEPPPSSGLISSDGHVSGREPLPNLLDISRSGSRDGRIFAARMLGRQRSPRARQRLEEMLADPMRKVRVAARRAIEAQTVHGKNERICDD